MFFCAFALAQPHAAQMGCGTAGSISLGIRHSCGTLVCVRVCARRLSVSVAQGEVPPYWVSRAAARAGQVDEEYEAMMRGPASPTLLTRMRDWMVAFLQRHGFLGVLLMASWPNMAFDMCGMAWCAGHALCVCVCVLC